MTTRGDSTFTDYVWLTIFERRCSDNSAFLHDVSTRQGSTTRARLLWLRSAALRLSGRCTAKLDFITAISVHTHQTTTFKRT